MGPYQHIEVLGLKELERRLIALGPKISSKLGNKATNDGAEIFRDDARSRARFTLGHSEGLIKKNIIMFRPRRKRMQFANEMHIGVRMKGSRKKRLAARTRNRIIRGRKTAVNTFWYWFYVEFGTQHMAAQPFLRPAFESSKTRAWQAVVKSIRLGLDRVNLK